MTLLEKSQAVEALFHDLEVEASRFHQEGGMGCISGCGFCCSNPEVPATALEFLPLAFDLHKKGLAEALAEELSTTSSQWDQRRPRHAPSACLLHPAQGHR